MHTKLNPSTIVKSLPPPPSGSTCLRLVGPLVLVSSRFKFAALSVEKASTVLYDTYSTCRYHKGRACSAKIMSSKVEPATLDGQSQEIGVSWHGSSSSTYVCRISTATTILIFCQLRIYRVS